MPVHPIYPKTGIFNVIGQIIMKEVYLSIIAEQTLDILSKDEHNWLEMFSIIEYNFGIPKTSLSANFIGQRRCLR